MLDLPRAAQLNTRLDGAPPEVILRTAIEELHLPMVSSFGAESVVLLHMAAQIDTAVPVLFLETGMLFPETLAYQQDLAQRLGLTDIRLIRPDPAALAARDPDATLHRTDPDACCGVRKVEPLDAALAGFPGWITGRKRFHGGRRVDLTAIEAAEGGRLIVNPLAHDDAGMLRAYMQAHDLPPHPLVAQGFRSIGCVPCTTPAAEGEDPRAGRWRGTEKVECGIHFIGGKAVRGPVEDAAATAPEAGTPPSGSGDAPAGAGVSAGATAPAVAPAPANADAAPAATLLVRDDGFHPCDLEAPVTLGPDSDPEALAAALHAPLVAIDFPAMSDGRGFTLARRLRAMGFAGRLRATGRLIADQYAMARRVGFDEVEITAALAVRQPADQWRARADWQTFDHRARLAG